MLNFRIGLIRALEASGYRIAVLAPADQANAKLEALGIAVEPIEMDRKGVSPGRDLLLLARYRKKLKLLSPDVFLGYTVKPNVWGSLAAQSLSIPVINNVSGLGTAFIKSSPLTAIVSRLYQTAFRRSNTVFFQNPTDSALFLEKKLVRPHQVRQLPGSGIDLSRFSPTQPAHRIGNGVAFIMVARLLRDKGVVEYVEAARQLRAIHPALNFRLLGPIDQDNRSAIGREQVSAWEAEGIIEYLGATDDVRPHVEASDCVVLPSYREGLPRTLLEGAAMARPLVATDVPGCRDVVSDGLNGYLCAVQDVSSLAVAMGKVAALSGEERYAMGLAGRALAEARFDERIVHRLYLDAIADALGSGD